MSITATCPGCRKQLNVKDEYIGRKLKCPQCGGTFTAEAGAPAPHRGGASRSASGPRGDRVPKFHLSPGVIALIVAFITIPTIFLLWSIGPGKVRAQWQQLEPLARDDVTDVVTRGIQAYMDQFRISDEITATHQPRAHDVTFVTSPLYLTMPDRIGFAGTSSEGAFVGRYNPRNGEIEAQVEIGGVTLPTGLNVKRGETTINVTGRNKDGVVTFEVDGKKPEQMKRRRWFDDDEDSKPDRTAASPGDTGTAADESDDED